MRGGLARRVATPAARRNLIAGAVHAAAVTLQTTLARARAARDARARAIFARRAKAQRTLRRAWRHYRQVCVGQKMRSLIKAEQDGAAATLQATMRGRTQRATILFDKATIAATKVWRMDRRKRVPWVRRHILSRSTDRSCRHEKEVATPPRSCPSRPNNAT